MRTSNFVLATVVLVTACTDQMDDYGDTEQSVVVNNRIAANRIAANRIAANRIAANRIAANRIAANRIAANHLAIGDLLETPEGIELFSFIISCALPEGETLEAEDPDDPSQTISFAGEVGLAPRWVDRPMSSADRHWVSACMFARVNNNNTTVAISMRGPSSALATTTSERATWSLQEGAFFGDMFLEPSRPLEWYACRGRAQAAGENGGLVDRDCTEPDPANPGHTLCGFNDAGDCADFEAPRNAYACATEAFGPTGFYLGCKTTAGFGTKPHHGHGSSSGHHHYRMADNDDEADDDFDLSVDGDGDDIDQGDVAYGHGHHSHGHGHQWGWGHNLHQQVITTYVQP